MRRPAALLALFVSLAASASAHVRLCDPTTLLPLAWPAPGAVSIVVSAQGGEGLDEEEHLPAVRNAIHAWNRVPSSGVRLVEDAAPAQRARTDFESFDLHQVRFDADGSSGFFPPGSGIVAVTPVTFAVGGAIVDADVVFNDLEFDFATGAKAGALDVQDVATHELGHFLGLDHTGNAGATMYPFVAPNEVLQRSLSADDEVGASEVAPAGPRGTIRGRVRRSTDGTPVSGAHVGATDGAGRSVSSTLTDATGAYELVFYAGGDYTIHVSPLDGPVRASNLSVEQPVETDFGLVSTGPVHLAPGGAVELGELFAGADGPVSLGAPGEELPLRGAPGEVHGTYVLHGTGLLPGSTLAASDPAVSLVGLVWLGGSVRFSVAVAPGAEPGNADLMVTTAAGSARLPGAVEVTSSDPEVNGLVPSFGLREGGYDVTLSGSGFRPGATVVVSEHAYRDGEDATVVDDGTLVVPLRGTTTGALQVDVVVIDPSGIEGRRSSGFRFTSVPTIASVFPPAGSTGGGTTFFIEGGGFEEDAVVRLNGGFVPSVRLDEGLLEVTSFGGAAAGPVALQVENAGGYTADGTFAWVDRPDPRVTSVFPASAMAGDRVLVSGSGFHADSAVLFGMDRTTGLGGVEGGDPQLFGTTAIEVSVPAGPVGAVSAAVVDRVTGQAHVLTSAVVIAAPPASGGGGGCHTAFVSPPGFRASDLAELAWLAALVAFALVLRRGGAGVAPRKVFPARS